MAEVMYNNSLGELGAPMASTDTSITFVASPGWATLASGDFIKLVVDPPTSTNPEPNPLFEIMYVTAYTAGATTATVSRAQEGTSAAAHAINATWLQALTVGTLSEYGVSSFNGRIGAVLPGDADYLAVATGGLTGATAATRYVGGTASGPPTTGTFAAGDFVVDLTGAIWICLTAGTPGTWVKTSWDAIATLTYGATVTPSAPAGRWQTLAVTSTAAFTIEAPTGSPSASMTTELTIEVLNSSGGTMGAITWNAIYVFPGLTWTNPANGLHRYARFEWNGSEYVCTGIAGADY